MTETLFPAYVFLDLTNADEVFYELKRIPEFSKLLGDNLAEFIPLEEEERKFLELLCANESPVNNADKGAGYYLVRNTKVYLDAQGEIERLDGPLEDQGKNHTAEFEKAVCTHRNSDSRRAANRNAGN